MSASSSTTTSNIMLAISEKKTKSVDLYKHLRNFIVHNYSELDARNLEKDLQTLKQLRNKVESGGAADFPAARRDLLQKYYRALCVVEPRFPISYNKDDVNTMKFTWFDAFKNKHKASQKSIHLEKAAVLFNLGAVHSQIGLSHDRSAEEGRKQASHSFMAAAGAFAFLRENVAISVGGSATVDISVECVGLLERLMLAQAQECVYENTIAKGNSPGSCLNILRQVGQFYEEALAALTVAPLSQHFEKAWISHVQLKAAIFLGEACYMYSLELHTEEIARLKLGVNALAEARKAAPIGAAQNFLDAVTKLETKINSKLKRAVKENDGVYMMGVPSASSLPLLPMLSLVKPTAMNDVLDASKEKMFASFDPDRIAKSISRYTEMVDDIIRREEEKLQQGSEVARVRLKEMDLPDSILAREGIIPLPTALKHEVEALLTIGNPNSLMGEMLKLRDLNRVNRALLEETEKLLQNSQSSTLAQNLHDRINEFAANLRQAADRDAWIETSFSKNYSLILILDYYWKEIGKPGSTRPPVYLYTRGDNTVRAMEKDLKQLETLGAQRPGFVDMLKEIKRKDDMQLPKLMTTTGSHEDLFRDEISKYDRIREDIAKNLESQEQVLMHIQAQNDEFVDIFDYKATCEKKYKEYEVAILKYRELQTSIYEAQTFYAILEETITQFRDMVDEVLKQLSALSSIDPVSETTPDTHTTSPTSAQTTSASAQTTQTTPASAQTTQTTPTSAQTTSASAQTTTTSAQTSPSGYSQQPPHSSQASHSNHPYPPPQHQQIQYTVSPYYWQPPHASWAWQGLYYNAATQQIGFMPLPPNPAQPQYPPPHQRGYERQ